jgi:hypothetical protein
MSSSGLLRCVALVRADVSEERIACIIRVEIISEHKVLLCSVLQLLVTANVVPSSPIFVILMVGAKHS